jgi:hypothetical protein
MHVAVGVGSSCQHRLLLCTMQGPSALTLDLVNVVRRMKLLGFNAIRLPFSFTGAAADPAACQEAGLTPSASNGCLMCHIS